MARPLRQQRRVMHGAIRSVVGPALAFALLALPLTAPGQTVQYAYDAAGRLSVVADSRGDVAVYQYDAVGNLLAIQRIAVGNVPDPVVVAYVTPDVGSPGSTVSIFGKGFGATADANVVAFNDVAAAVLTASPTRLTVRVPAGAITGPIRVTTPLGVATSKPFRVLGALSVTPAIAVVAPRGTVRFTASGDAADGVRWSVDGVAGGNAQRGTISVDGVYVAPASPPPGGIRVAATSVVDAALEATAHVSVVASRPVFVAAEPLTVVFPPASPRVEVTTMASVGVAANGTLAVAAPVAVRVAPMIVGLSPSTAARGATIRLVVVGVGFEGATQLEFWTETGPDTAVAASDLVIAADGNEASAEVAVSADAALGPRVVRLVTPAGSSGGAVHDDNVFIIH